MVGDKEKTFQKAGKWCNYVVISNSFKVFFFLNYSEVLFNHCQNDSHKTTNNRSDSEGVDKKGPSDTQVCSHVNEFSHYGSQSGSSSKSKHWSSLTTVFIKALFTIIKFWTNAVFTAEERIRKMCYIYRMRFFLTIKKDKNCVFVGKLMQLEMVILKQFS